MQYYKVTGIKWDMPTTLTVGIADNIKDWTEIGNEIEKSLKANFGVKPTNFTYVIDDDTVISDSANTVNVQNNVKLSELVDLAKQDYYLDHFNVPTNFIEEVCYNALKIIQDYFPEDKFENLADKFLVNYIGEIVGDVYETADKEFSEGDVRLAIKRTILKNLKLED